MAKRIDVVPLLSPAMRTALDQSREFRAALTDLPADPAAAADAAMPAHRERRPTTPKPLSRKPVQATQAVTISQAGS